MKAALSLKNWSWAILNVLNWKFQKWFTIHLLTRLHSATMLKASFLKVFRSLTLVFLFWVNTKHWTAHMNLIQDMYYAFCLRVIFSALSIPKPQNGPLITGGVVVCSG